MGKCVCVCGGGKFTQAALLAKISTLPVEGHRIRPCCVTIFNFNSCCLFPLVCLIVSSDLSDVGDNKNYISDFSFLFFSPTVLCVQILRVIQSSKIALTQGLHIKVSMATQQELKRNHPHLLIMSLRFLFNPFNEPEIH